MQVLETGLTMADMCSASMEPPSVKVEVAGALHRRRGAAYSVRAKTVEEPSICIGNGLLICEVNIGSRVMFNSEIFRVGTQTDSVKGRLRWLKQEQAMSDPDTERVGPSER